MHREPCLCKAPCTGVSYQGASSVTGVWAMMRPDEEEVRHVCSSMYGCVGIFCWELIVVLLGVNCRSAQLNI